MFTKRIIPYLNVNNGRVVKGVNFVSLRDTGDPVEIAAACDRAGADGLVFLDITTSSDNHCTVVDIVGGVAGTAFIPSIAGGGMYTVEDFHMLLQEGADKIPINSSAINNPRLISDTADKFGRQYVMVAIGTRHRADGKGRNIHKHGGCVGVGTDALEWAIEADRLGAGEILLTSTGCDGTRNGYDNELISLIVSHVSVSAIASGGTGNKEYLYDVLTEGGADVVLAASLFHCRELEIGDLKEYLLERGIAVRI